MKKHWALRAGGAAIVMAAALAAPRAVAQTDGSQADVGQADDAIIVTAERATTATKTDTPIVETPQSISVVTEALFEDRGAQNVQETLRYSAGVTAEAYGLDTRGDGSTIRGLSPVEFLDGMRRLYNYSPIPRVDVATLSRVEVLRGPSSVLYGQAANGGILNLVSKRPEFVSGGTIAARYGTHDRKQIEADVTGPLGGDFAGRIVGLVRDSDMQTDTLRDDRILLSPSLTWRPDDRTSLTAIGIYQRDRTASSQQFLPVVATLLADGDRRLSTSTFLGDPDVDKLNGRQLSLTLLGEHRYSDNIALRVGLRYTDARSNFQEIYAAAYFNPTDPFLDPERTIVPRAIYVVRPDTKTFTGDTSAQFDFATGPFEHKLLIGLDFTDYTDKGETGSDVTTPIDIYNPVSTGVVLPALTDYRQRSSQVGVYFQDQIRYADRVTLVVGARRDRARTKLDTAPEEIDEATTFRAGLIAEIAKGLSPYMSYSESFLPVTGLGQSLAPQRGRQYEAGIKWQPLSGALFTVALFDIEETNRPINDPENPVQLIQTGKVRARGVELEGSYAIANDFTLTAAFSHTKTEVKVSSVPQEIGRQLNDTPKTLASLWASKFVPLGDEAKLQLGAGVRHVGATTSIALYDFVFDGELRTPSYTLADALVAVDWRQWRLSVNATNLFDKEYFAPCRWFGDCFTGNGRTVVGTLAYKF